MNCPLRNIRNDACQAMEELLRHEPITNVTVECVQRITAKIEQRNFNVNKEMIDLFLALPLECLEPLEEDKEALDAEQNKIKYKTKVIVYYIFILCVFNDDKKLRPLC